MWAHEWGYTPLILVAAQGTKRGYVRCLIIISVSNLSSNTAIQKVDFIMVDIQTNDETLALINTYGPNTDDPGVFQKSLRPHTRFLLRQYNFRGRR